MARLRKVANVAKLTDAVAGAAKTVGGAVMKNPLTTGVALALGPASIASGIGQTLGTAKRNYNALR